jgi:hypothetical protein
MATKHLSIRLPRVEWARLIPFTLQVAFFGIMAALVAANAGA